MKKRKGLAKAAAMMAMLAALATMLAVSLDPPPAQSASNTRAQEARRKGIPVPVATPKGGVSVAQERSTAVERREAGGGRAPVNASGTQQ
jgi:hypothetical protein